MNADLATRVNDGFHRAFGRLPMGAVRAPGRVNLIGEHTDYNGGFVLPCALSVETRIAWGRRDDGQVRVHACEFGGEEDTFALTDIVPHPGGGWRDYVRAMVWSMSRDIAGLRGVDLAIGGDIPRGSGLSSSASLQVAVGHALLAAAGRSEDAVRLALMAQHAENAFVGVQCGNMDQLASAASSAGAALLIDCRDLVLTPVPLPEDWTILIVHSGVERGLVDGHYNARRAQCEEAARAMGVALLREANLPALEAARARMSKTAARRARHVITENDRVVGAAQAMRSGDLAAIGQLMAASHASMRDDFEITVPAIDRLVEITQGLIGAQGGARMTGGGFGGAIVALVPAARAADVAEGIATLYRTPDGQAPLIMTEQPMPGAGPIPA